MNAGELIGKTTIHDALVGLRQTLAEAEEQDDEYFNSGGYLSEAARFTAEQLSAEQTVRKSLFSDSVESGQVEVAKCSILDKYQGTSEGLLFTEQDTVCASFQDAFAEKKRNSYGSFEAMFQETLLDGDLEAQFANLQNNPVPVLGVPTYQPNTF